MENSRKSPSTDTADAPLVAAVADCLARHTLASDNLTVGLSGGADSVVLLHLLARLRNGLVSALHVNHHISPVSDQWERFCHQLCTAQDIPYASISVDVERNAPDGLEAAARRARHQVFAATAADWIVLAHQRDDQAETLLFNLLRGAGVAGAAAMRERNGRLLRPLLAVGRKAIQDYARRHQLQWCEDESNSDQRFSRNFLRQRILPELKLRFPAASEKLADAAGRFAEARDLLDVLAHVDLGAAPHCFPVSVSVLARLEETRARNVLRYLLSLQHAPIPSAARLREALRQLVSAGSDRHPEVRLGRFRLLRRRGMVYLEPDAVTPDSS